MTQPLRISIADDEADMRDFLEKMLPRCGHQVVSIAENGRQLVEHCRQTLPDLVITDIKMPELDGIEASTEINRDRPVPVILVSAYHDPALIDRAEGNHVSAYLVKPVSFADLQPAIAVAVRRFTELQSVRSENADLKQALADRKLIEQAKGILMKVAGVDEKEAHRRLQGLSADLNKKLVEAAQQVIAMSKAFGPAELLGDEVDKPALGETMKKSITEVLIVDDDEEFRPLLFQRLSRSGFLVEAAANASQALEIAQRRQFDVAVFDMQMPGMSGLELLEKYKAQFPEGEVILLTGQGTIETAVQAMQLGAFTYLLKPFVMSELEAQIKKAAERRTLRKENEQLRNILSRSQKGKSIIGNSAAMKEIFRLVERAGPSERAILIQGESGTGKELVAEALHHSSQRADRPLVAVNCAALPETLLESELFGHEKGAFTGAVAAKQGLFEAADGGTLFIDEIGEMPGSLQAKLLRVLENGSMRRVGSIQERKVDVRLLAATNRDLSVEIKAGRFREDLYYRINVMSLELPPLREREGDIELLVDHFLGDDWHIEEDALRALNRYSWPGNVRQLINVLECAKILADDDAIRLKDLPKEVILGGASGASTVQTSTTVDTTDDLHLFQRQKVLAVLQRESFNKAKAARALGISRRKLYRLLEKYGLADSGAATPLP